jgi:hypothetical protein
VPASGGVVVERVEPVVGHEGQEHGLAALVVGVVEGLDAAFAEEGPLHALGRGPVPNEPVLVVEQPGGLLAAQADHRLAEEAQLEDLGVVPPAAVGQEAVALAQQRQGLVDRHRPTPSVRWRSRVGG